VICFVCYRVVRPGSDWAARYEWRRPVSGDISPDFVYGKGERPLAQAQGLLVKVSHNKCYHAYKKQLELAAAKAADPSAQPGPDQDWRHQETIDVGELTGEGN
jgi:hypothetical protein